MICPYCKAALASARVIACTECATPLHEECAALHGARCVTLGCGSRTFGPPARGGRRRLEPAMPASLWLRRGALAAFAIAAPPLEDAALAVAALVGVAAIACLI